MKIHQLILVGIGLTILILFTTYTTKDEEEIIQETEAPIQLGIKESHKLKNIEYTKAEWKAMRAEKVNKMSLIIGKQRGLLGASEDYPDDSQTIKDIDTWFELAAIEGCLNDNVEGMVGWDWIEEINNKLSNELCSKSIVKIKPVNKDSVIVEDFNLIKK